MARAAFVAAVLCAILVAPLRANAAGPPGWPNRPVRIVVPFGPGSTPDIVARLLGDRLQAKFGQPFVIENKAGAGGNLGTDAVAKAEPDGYTLGVSIVGPLALNALLFPRMPYDPATDLAPVALLTGQPGILVVGDAVPAHSVAQLVALLKRDPGKYNFGSIGVGSLSHLAMQAIATQSGTQPVHIPFSGSPAAITALIRGDVQMAVLPAGSVVAQAREGGIRMLAVTIPNRWSVLPDLPTLKEEGITGVEADAWNGLIAPAGTPPEIVARLERAVGEILHDPEMRRTLNAQFMEPYGEGAEALRAMIRAELDRWGPVIHAQNIRLGQ